MFNFTNFSAVLAALLFCFAGLAHADDSFFDDAGDLDTTDVDSSEFSVFDSLESDSNTTVQPSGVTLSGRALIDLRLYDQQEQVSGEPTLYFDLEQVSARQTLNVNFKLNQASLSDNLIELLDQATLTHYGSSFDLTLGLNKVSWGKGDSLHVLDVINGQDRSSFYTGDLLDQKKSTYMVKLDKPVGMLGMLELVYVPFQTADTLAMDGIWAPAELVQAQAAAYQTIYSELYNASYAVSYGGLYTTAYNQAFATNGGDPDAARATADADPTIIPTAQAIASAQATSQTKSTLDNALNVDIDNHIASGQFATRYSNSLGSVDYGLQYYYGTEKLPTLADISAATSADLNDPDFNPISYEPIQLFGVDAAFVLLGFNNRIELAYTLAENKEDSVSYVVGFDRSLGINNASLNVQVEGHYGLDSEVNTNTLAAVIEDYYKNETFKLQLLSVMNLEGLDYFVSPKLTYSSSDNLDVSAAYYYFNGDTGTVFGSFTENSFVEFGINYSF